MTISPEAMLLLSLAAVVTGGWIIPKGLDWRNERRRERNRAALIAGVDRALMPPEWPRASMFPLEPHSAVERLAANAGSLPQEFARALGEDLEYARFGAALPELPWFGAIASGVQAFLGRGTAPHYATQFRDQAPVPSTNASRTGPWASGARGITLGFYRTRNCRICGRSRE